MWTNANASAAISEAHDDQASATPSGRVVQAVVERLGQLAIPAEDVRHLVPGLVDQRRGAQQVVPDDLDGGRRVLGAAIPEPQASLQDRRAKPLVDVGEHDRCGVAQLIEQQAHAAVREDVAGAQQARHARTGPRVDGVGVEVERRLRPHEPAPERQQTQTEPRATPSRLSADRSVAVSTSASRRSLAITPSRCLRNDSPR